MTTKAKYLDLQKVTKFSPDTLSNIQNISIDVLRELDKLTQIKEIASDEKHDYVAAKAVTIKAAFDALYQRICEHVIVGESIDDVYASIDSIILEIEELLVYVR
jgi:hypothetical protein